MSKKLCDLKKLLKTDYQSFIEHVREASHACRKCGRVANDKDRLCKPEKIGID